MCLIYRYCGIQYGDTDPCVREKVHKKWSIRCRFPLMAIRSATNRKKNQFTMHLSTGAKWQKMQTNRRRWERALMQMPFSFAVEIGELKKNRHSFEGMATSVDQREKNKNTIGLNDDRGITSCLCALLCLLFSLDFSDRLSTLDYISIVFFSIFSFISVVHSRAKP